MCEQTFYCKFVKMDFIKNWETLCDLFERGKMPKYLNPKIFSQIIPSSMSTLQTPTCRETAIRVTVGLSTHTPPSYFPTSLNYTVAFLLNFRN